MLKFPSLSRWIHSIRSIYCPRKKKTSFTLSLLGLSKQLWCSNLFNNGQQCDWHVSLHSFRRNMTLLTSWYFSEGFYPQIQTQGEIGRFCNLGMQRKHDSLNFRYVYALRKQREKRNKNSLKFYRFPPCFRLRKQTRFFLPRFNKFPRCFRSADTTGGKHWKSFYFFLSVNAKFPIKKTLTEKFVFAEWQVVELC